MLTNPTIADAGLRPTIPPNAENVLSALRRAADETGTDFGYLLTTAMRESQERWGCAFACVTPP